MRVAQRLISALETPTASGACYEIDSRLRPSGNQGTLVTSLAVAARPLRERRDVLGEAGAAARATGRRRRRGGRARSRRCAATSCCDRSPPARPPRSTACACAWNTSSRGRPPRARPEARSRRPARRRERRAVPPAPARARAPRSCSTSTAPNGRSRSCARSACSQPGQRDACCATAGSSSSGSRAGCAWWRTARSRDLDEERGDLDGLARRLGYAAGDRESSARRALLRRLRAPHRRDPGAPTWRSSGSRGPSRPADPRPGPARGRRGGNPTFRPLHGESVRTRSGDPERRSLGCPPSHAPSRTGAAVRRKDLPCAPRPR